MRYIFYSICILLCSSAHAQEMQYFSVQSGSGFFVNRDFLITNAHVVKGCTKVSITGGANDPAAEIVAQDVEHDLALIKSEAQPAEFAPLRLEIDTIKVGDDVMVIGYPGEKGARGEYTVTTAQVQKVDFNNAGNPWRFYISDVVQHGNSGGPVLDTSGNVIGVAEGMMQLKTINMNTQEQISEQRVGVVITLRELQRFLENHGVFAQWSGSGLLQFSEATLENDAKRFIVNVQCRQKADPPPPDAPQQEMQ